MPDFVQALAAQQSTGEVKVVRKTVKNCIHHWHLDSADFGICRKCGLSRLFRLSPAERRASFHLADKEVRAARKIQKGQNP